MAIFNHTFTNDKPIYFPDNWHTGKTLIQLHQQWQTTTEYWIYSNILQILASSLLIALIFVIILAWKEVRRIRNLDDNSINKKYQAKYISASFVVSLALLSILCLYFVYAAIVEQWTRLAFLKGLVSCSLAYGLYYGYATWKQRMVQKRKKRAGEQNQRETKKQ